MWKGAVSVAARRFTAGCGREGMGAPLVEVDEWLPSQHHESDSQQGGAERPLAYFYD